MHVHKPYCSPFSGWIVLIKKDKTPTSETIEEIKCQSREEAWQTYRRIKKGI